MKAFLGLILVISMPAAAIADSAVLILNGVPGSPDHAERFIKWTEATRTAMIETFGFAEDDVVVLSNREARADDVRNAFAGLAERVGTADVLFVFFIGHGSFDGTEYKFNILGPDLTASDYDVLLSSVGAGRTVIVNTTNSSGGAIETLAAQNRVIITATRSGTERNDTIFYDHFLEALTETASDEDKNERLSIWEAFRYAALAVERFYTEENRLATEHPQISEPPVQRGYLARGPGGKRYGPDDRVTQILVINPLAIWSPRGLITGEVRQEKRLSSVDWEEPYETLSSAVRHKRDESSVERVAREVIPSRMGGQLTWLSAVR